MNRIVILLVVAVVACQAAFRFDSDLDEEWRMYKEKFNKRYHSHEELRRRVTFEYNYKTIEAHNKGDHSYTLAINEFADMTNEEFRQKFLGYRMKHTPAKELFVAPVADEPDTVDWRDKNIVTDIKNQQQCGSCWAFSTTGSVEGQHALKTKKLVSLSEQNLVDCSGPEGNQGCNGGLMDQGFQYIIDNKGIDTEESYPYEAVDGKCRFDKANVGATITGYKDIPTGDEKALKSAVATVGPISVAIDASQFSFQFYSGGVYDEEGCSSTLLDHGVLAVGYGTDSGTDYWLVKNSWGESWGLTGYIKMSRNKNNQCGIATQSSYPTV